MLFLADKGYAKGVDPVQMCDQIITSNVHNYSMAAIDWEIGQALILVTMQ